MRYILSLFFLLSLLDAKTSVDDKIKRTNSQIDSIAKTKNDINKKMGETADAIIAQKKEIEVQRRRLGELGELLADKESSHEQNIKQLDSLKGSQDELQKKQEELEEELVFTIAQSISLSMILQEEYAIGEESLIEYEVLQAMLKSAKTKIKELNEKFYDTSKDIEAVNEKVKSLEIAIADIDSKRDELIKVKKANEESLQSLHVAKESYKKRLKEILSRQDSLTKTLSELNIIKIDELKRAEEEAKRAQAFDAKDILSDTDLPKVKTHGSSYQAAKTKNYTGEKTIPPFDPYRITKEYGNYTDPIYGIKVFNESISLKPNEKNAKVKTVFNGKVIFADRSPVLDNIVIVEHDDGLHTIYANLSQISPDIKKGVKIKKGYTIGRVSDELIFEVTQKSYHINPVRLFQ